MVRIYGVSFETYLPYFYLGLAYYELGQYSEALWAWEVAERQGAVLESPQFKILAKLRKDAELKTIDAPAPVAERVPAKNDERKPSPKRPEPYVSEDTLANLKLHESHALVVGVSNYGDRSAWPSLPGVQEDVQVVSEALRRQGFQVDVVRDPTRNELSDAMHDFFHSGSEAGRMLFYYAGHGATVNIRGAERGYLVPVDAPSPTKDPQGFQRTGISMAVFQQYAAEARVRHLAFLFDSCFSGAVFDVVRSGAPSGSAQDKIKERSRIFIAAGDANQEVPDKSYFRRAFVEALEGAADMNGDGMVFGIELGQFVADEVTNRFYQTENKQTPRWGRSGDDAKGDFPFRIVD